MPILTDPFGALLADLKRAKDLFESSDDAAREGVIASVEAVARFLMASRFITDSGLQSPLIVLLSDLKSFDEGTSPALLKPKKKRGRTRKSSLRDSLIGFAVCTADKLTECGLDPKKADEMVARELKKEGIKPSRQGADGNQGHIPQITEVTICGWRKKVREDVGRRSVAARVYDSTKPLFDIAGALSMEQKQKSILMQLQILITHYRSLKST